MPTSTSASATRWRAAVARLLYRVRIGYVDEAALARIDPKSTLVFVMNHRSNMDYVLVAFLAAERVTLSYAVGEWARIWPLQQLVRAMGAFFVRRNSGDALYRTVLARYVHMATEAGVTQAVFPEGGLTVDGKLRPPKYRPARLHAEELRRARRRRSGATSSSSRSASTTTACWKTAASCSSCIRERPRAGPAAGAEDGAGLQSAQSLAGACRAAGTASATPASISARRCRCAPGAANTASHFPALADDGAPRRRWCRSPSA